MQTLATLFPNHLAEVARRTEDALGAASYGSLLVHSGTPPAVFLDDQSYPFKVEAPFKTWAPLTDVPECFVYFEPGRRPVLVFHRSTDYWHKPAAVPESYWASHFDIRVAGDRSAARAALPHDLSHAAFVGVPFPELVAWGVGAVNPEHLIARLHYPRARKTPYELECLRAANRSAALGHAAARLAFAEGASELEIHFAFLRASGLREQELPYNAIVALNEGGAVLHYQFLERERPPERHSLLIDAGTEFAGYASDVTRTYAHDDADFAALVGKMDEVQQSLCAGVHAGVDWRDVHLSAHRLIAELLHEADITRLEADAAIDSGLSSVFFPHGIGHLLGLQVHDVGGTQRGPEGGEIPRPPGHPWLRLTRVLEENMVVTMEPGIYFIEPLLEQARGDGLAKHINWSRVRQLRKFGGIRIEDDLAVTIAGCENLTRDAFRGN
jgi:Xaa-Pro dipeptidase